MKHAQTVAIHLTLGVPLAFWQCSGVNPVRIPDASVEDSTTSSSSGGGDETGSSSGGESSSSSGGVEPPDAGTEDAAEAGGDGTTKDAAGEHNAPCIGPEGGVPCDPGLVPCGGEAGACTTVTSACCQPSPQNGGRQGTCIPNTGSCPSGQDMVQCNEAADCPPGQVCCENFPAIATLGPTSCMPSCTGGSYQICRTHAECALGDAGNPPHCILQTCMGFGFGRGGSVTLEACEVPGAMGGGVLAYCTAN